MSADRCASPDSHEAGAGSRGRARLDPDTRKSVSPRGGADDRAPSSTAAAPDLASSPSPADLLAVLERLSAGDDRLLGHVTLPGRSG
ncbi:MAG: hypothetical protein E6212_07195, partial [Actinomyces sp.]|nr:hypothetical protein [Actinomyces sp.]